MYGLMIRKIPKDTKIPAFIHRSDYWNKKTWAIELGIFYSYHPRISERLQNNCQKIDNEDYDTYYYFTNLKSLLKLAGLFPLMHLLWAARMIQKNDCEVYVYETYI